MTHKYERQCWNCGSKNMEKLANHVKCRDCGATWNVVPTLGAAPRTEVDFMTGGSPKAHSPTKFKPRAVRRTHAKVVEN